MNNIVRLGDQLKTRTLGDNLILVTQEAITANAEEQELLFVESDRLGKIYIDVYDPITTQYHVDNQKEYIFVYTVSAEGIEIFKIANTKDFDVIDVARVTDEFINDNTDSMKHIHGSYIVDFETVNGCYKMRSVTDRKGNKIELHLIEAAINLEYFGKCKKHTIK